MTARRQARVLSVLLRRGDWVTAGYLADHLGVTPRSVRSYVTGINRRSSGGDAVESGPQGYRATPAARGLRLSALEHDRGTPRERLHALLRLLLDESSGVDVYATADRLYVSAGTLEGDLRRVRGLLRGSELALERQGAVVRLTGSELARRRLVSRVVHDDVDEGSFDIDALGRAADAMNIPAEAFGAFKADLVERLAGLGHVVNELSAADVVLHVAIAADRVSRGHALGAADERTDADRDAVADIVGELAARHFGAEMGEGDRRHLASLVLLSIVDPGSAGEGAGREVAPEIVDAVRAAVARAADTYGLEVAQDPFVDRLALHVENLVRRAAEQLWSRNPMTRSLKAASPMVFEMAVAIAGDLSEALGVPIPDDEITDIAMHLGTALDLDRQASSRLTATLVSPGYDTMRRQLRASLVRALGHELDVTGIHEGYDPDWGAIGTDLVLTTIEPPAHVPGGSERVVRIPPFLGDRDVARIADAANRVRRQRRLGGLRAEMERWFVPAGFVRDVDAASPEDVIRRLGAALVADGAIDEAYVASAIERERLSSTAFTESLAVPHAMTMSASRTAIAVAVNEHAIEWGSDRVHVVALVAFSESDRAAFQTIFEQFVDVFADPENARRLTRRGETLPAFLTELAALIDEG
ncbi:BglG family transcription antiterminator [Microbacterium karelineae]|uniref:BglG family transcription antiterminator n=1 Tax=Microbacterium karelineae TaxID=2654283 RepID=UPI0012EB045D|nr:PTS sugar transporter subunit IIA [Microbacterium karelineae]